MLSVAAFVNWVRSGEEKARETFGQISIVIWSILGVVGVIFLVARTWSLIMVSAMSALESRGISSGLAMILFIISLSVIGSLISFAVSEMKSRRKKPKMNSVD